MMTESLGVPYVSIIPTVSLAVRSLSLLRHVFMTKECFGQGTGSLVVRILVVLRDYTDYHYVSTRETEFPTREVFPL